MYCNGSVCDNAKRCNTAGLCTYKSSAQQAQEEAMAGFDELFPVKDPNQLPLIPRAVEDFKGKVDGGGYKASMDDPRKVPLSLIDPEFLDGVGRVLKHGAKKYAPGNWMRGMSYREVISAMQRHIGEIQKGHDRDSDTNELHVYHLACGAMFLARFQSHEEYAEFDDRLFK